MTGQIALALAIGLPFVGGWIDAWTDKDMDYVLPFFAVIACIIAFWVNWYSPFYPKIHSMLVYVLIFLEVSSAFVGVAMARVVEQIILPWLTSLISKP